MIYLNKRDHEKEIFPPDIHLFNDVILTNLIKIVTIAIN
jgi:hypothetical protein